MKQSCPDTFPQLEFERLVLALRAAVAEFYAAATPTQERKAKILVNSTLRRVQYLCLVTDFVQELRAENKLRGWVKVPTEWLEPRGASNETGPFRNHPRLKASPRSQGFRRGKGPWYVRAWEGELACQEIAPAEFYKRRSTVKRAEKDRLATAFTCRLAAHDEGLNRGR